MISCSDNTHEETLCQAEILMNKDQFEDAYALLDSIDGGSFYPGSRNQARYALLYTKAQFKNYIDSDNDSLITLSVDYAEAHGEKTDKFYAYLYQGIVRYLLNDYSNASVSLIRSLANADVVEDCYSKGQMYLYLAKVNGALQSSDEADYAQKAYDEFVKGGLNLYAISSMITKAVSMIHAQDLDSARILIDECIADANNVSNTFLLNNAISIKAKYALLVDSVNLARQLYSDLESIAGYVWTNQDYENMAYLQAELGNRDLAYDYLNRSKALMILSDANKLSYWIKAVDISRILCDNTFLVKFQDSLIYYQDCLLGQAVLHSSIAAQRDYSEWQLNLLQLQNRQKIYLLSGLLLLFLILVTLSFLIFRRKNLLIQLQTEKIEKYQLKIKQHEKENSTGLQQIKSSEIVSELRKATISPGLQHIDWDALYNLFCDNLPLFENALRELTSLSETEWRTCMLLKLDFSPSNIAILLNKSAEGVSSIRRRLYYKVFKKKGRSADWDQFICSL